MTTLSVVMATFNGASWVEEQLASLVGQTRPPDEIVVSDDGSTDGTVDAVRRFAEHSPVPVVTVAGPRRGLAENFWSAASRTGSDLVAWADQDDVWHPEKLARCEDALLEGAADLVSHSAAVVMADRTYTGRRYPDYPMTRALSPLEGDPWHVPSGFATVVRRSLLHRVPWAARPVSHQTGRTMNHDHAVALTAFVSARRVELAETLADYRQHASNVAGAPRLHGMARLRFALTVGGSQYADLARRAAEYGAFVARVVDRAPTTDEYFAELTGRCERRAAVYNAGAPLSRRLGRLGAGAGRGVYGPRTSGGFGPMALAKDAVDVVAARALGVR